VIGLLRPAAGYWPQSPCISGIRKAHWLIVLQRPPIPNPLSLLSHAHSRLIVAMPIASKARPSNGVWAQTSGGRDPRKGCAGFPATDFPTVKLSAVPSSSPTPPSVRYRFCPSIILPLSIHSLDCRIHLNNFNRFAKSVSHSLLDHARLKVNEADVRDVNIYRPEQHQLLINLSHHRT
jgi:hypothetical protein